MNARTVLVVEDTELLRRIYTDKLVQDGYEVHAAADGIEALQHLRSSHVDLILLDLIMPRMSGLEVLDTIRKDPRTCDIPALILSNLGQESDLERGMEMGAVGYLVKNEAKPDEVSALIHDTLERFQARQVDATSYSVVIKDGEVDADRLAEHLRLPRRFWCPACEVELVLELIPEADRPGWFDAHVTCPRCEKDFS